MQHFTTPSCTPAAILLVEDDAPLRQGLTELLSREGYTVMAAACAREAREKLDGSIRLIVLDITLPDGDGVALCRAWRGEYRILLTLVQQQGIVSRSALLEALWDVDSRFIDDNTLSVHISRLREKIGAQHIRTMRGVGYQWMD